MDIFFFVIGVSKKMQFLATLLVYSLFGLTIRNKERVQQFAVQEVQTVPKELFGVFVTLSRYGSHDNVHGCLGNWTPDYTVMSPERVVSLVSQLAVDVRYNDSRKHLFQHDIDQDAQALVEMNLMQLPLIPIDTDNGTLITTGEPFDNSVYGLIVVSVHSDGSGEKKATYLPRVFPYSSWPFIRKSLLKKAGVLSKQPQHPPTLQQQAPHTRFFAYKTTRMTFNVYEQLFSKKSLHWLTMDVAAFYAKYFQDFIPFTFNQHTEAVTTDTTEAVRNMACLVDVLHLSRLYPSVLQLTDKPVVPLVNLYYKQWTLDEKNSRQASIFILQALRALGTPGDTKKSEFMAEQLVRHLQELEPQFELG